VASLASGQLELIQYKEGKKKRVVSDWLIHSIKKKRHPPLGFLLGSPFLRLQLFDG
jgi:hypothetical protein